MNIHPVKLALLFSPCTCHWLSCQLDLSNDAQFIHYLTLLGCLQCLPTCVRGGSYGGLFLSSTGVHVHEQSTCQLTRILPSLLCHPRSNTDEQPHLSSSPPGAPGLGPLSLRKDVIVFKDGFRSRYCFSSFFPFSMNFFSADVCWKAPGVTLYHVILCIIRMYEAGVGSCAMQVPCSKATIVLAGGSSSVPVAL